MWWIGCWLPMVEAVFLQVNPQQHICTKLCEFYCKCKKSMYLKSTVVGFGVDPQCFPSIICHTKISLQILIFPSATNSHKLTYFRFKTRTASQLPCVLLQIFCMESLCRKIHRLFAICCHTLKTKPMKEKYCLFDNCDGWHFIVVAFGRNRWPCASHVHKIAVCQKWSLLR